MSSNRIGLVTDETEIRSYLKGDIPDTEFRKSYEEWKYTLHLGNEVYVSTDDLPKQLE